MGMCYLAETGFVHRVSGSGHCTVLYSNEVVDSFVFSFELLVILIL